MDWMPAYRPYLLPLLSLSVRPGASIVQSPLEEESIIRNLAATDWPGWTQLASMIRDEYGLRFIVSSLPGLKCEGRGTNHGTGTFFNPSSHPLRYVLLMEAGKCLFVIEHPDGLILFDHLGKLEQSLVLARPSVFAQWWLQGPNPSKGEQEVGPVQKNSKRQALDTILLDMIHTYHPSDWHLEPGPDQYQSRLRIDGRLFQHETFTRPKGIWLINSFTRACHLEEGTALVQREGSTELNCGEKEPVSLRISLIPALHGEAMVIRFLYPRDPTMYGLHGLGFTPGQILLLERQFHFKEGLWVVAGPTGAGKSTTLHTLLRWSVQDKEKVLSVEDPVERTMEGVQQVSVGTPPGMTYAVAMRAFLRQSPDSILIGEIRDQETASLSIQAARTGHRVLSSLHARHPAGILHRLEDLGQASGDLDSVLRILIIQRLVPLLCPQCRKDSPLPKRFKEAFETWFSPLPETVSAPGDCPSCHDGFNGQTALTWCSTWPCKMAEDGLFLKPASNLFREGKIDLSTLLPFIPQETRNGFPICQQGGFC